MKYILSVAFLFLSFFSFTSLADPTSNDNNNMVNQSMGSAASDIQKKEAEIIKIMFVINDNDIDAANLALKKSHNPHVKKYAELMKTDHTKNIKTVKDLMIANKISPLTSDFSLLLEKKGKNELDKLNALQGKEFDQAYLNASINEHKKALEVIDTRLIPHASNPQVLKFLKSTRVAIKHHLQAAEKTQKKLS